MYTITIKAPSQRNQYQNIANRIGEQSMNENIFLQMQSLKHSVRLLYVSAPMFSSEWHSVLHTHTNAELFFVLNGEGQFCVETEIFSMKKHDIVIISANISHTELHFENKDFEYVVVGMDGIDFFNAAHMDCGYLHFKSSESSDELLPLFNLMLTEIEQKNAEYNRLCQDVLDILMIKIMRTATTAITITPAKRSNKECDKIKKYIDVNFTKEITLASLAEMAHLSKYYLVHSFTKKTGVSPIVYLNDRRIEESKRLLSSTDYSVLNISAYLGFTTQSYFGHCFKMRVGMSPIEFRKAALNL